MEGRILVTGGAGFLGSHFIRYALGRGAERVINVDLLTYAGDRRRLADVEGDERYEFVRGDVADAGHMKAVVESERPTAIVHYAAESHVTRSETDPGRFERTNIEGTQTMLEAALSAGTGRFLFVSTDEVYGPIERGCFEEGDKLPGPGKATSAYAQSKAMADDVARSYSDRIEVVVARPTNAFGPWQFPEKAFPRWVTRGLRRLSLPVWGDGQYVRQWLFAEDFARAIGLLLQRGDPGEVYNVGPLHDPEITNLDLAQWIAARLDLPGNSVQLTAYDRPDHDRRYAVDPSKINALGWRAGPIETQFEHTVDWYRDNDWWWQPHLREAESIYSDDVRVP